MIRLWLFAHVIQLCKRKQANIEEMAKVLYVIKSF